MLEKLRSYGGFTISINSGYRTSAYNKKIGGATGSYHTKGMAIDAVVYKDGKAVAPKYIACLAQDLGFKGIATMHTATHLDMAPRIYRGDEYKGGVKTYASNVGNDFYKYFGVKKAEIEALKKAVEPQKEEEEEMVKYTKLTDVPSYYKEVIQLLIDKGWLSGTGSGEINVTEDFCRIMTILYRAGVFEQKAGATSTKDIATALITIAQAYK